jgi:predicted O-methyltransferase YrrM
MLPSVLNDALATDEVIRADGTRIPLLANVSSEEATRLYNLVRARKPDATIEIGLAQGISALAIAQALRDNESGALHHVVDPFQSTTWEGVGIANLDRAGLLEHVRFHEALPEVAVPTFPTADFAFIDASHLFDLTVLDFVLVDKRLTVGGMIGFHDLWMESLRKVVRYILTNRHYRIYNDVPSKPSARPSTRSKAKSKAKSQLVALARRTGMDRFLSPELRQPNADLGLGQSMVFVEKTGQDERDWRFHAPF